MRLNALLCLCLASQGCAIASHCASLPCRFCSWRGFALPLLYITQLCHCCPNQSSAIPLRQMADRNASTMVSIGRITLFDCEFLFLPLLRHALIIFPLNQIVHGAAKNLRQLLAQLLCWACFLAFPKTYTALVNIHFLCELRLGKSSLYPQRFDFQVNTPPILISHMILIDCGGNLRYTGYALCGNPFRGGGLFDQPFEDASSRPKKRRNALGHLSAEPKPPK